MADRQGMGSNTGQLNNDSKTTGAADTEKKEPVKKNDIRPLRFRK